MNFPEHAAFAHRDKKNNVPWRERRQKQKASGHKTPQAYFVVQELFSAGQTSHCRNLRKQLKFEHLLFRDNSTEIRLTEITRLVAVKLSS